MSFTLKLDVTKLPLKYNLSAILILCKKEKNCINDPQEQTISIREKQDEEDVSLPSMRVICQDIYTTASPFRANTGNKVKLFDTWVSSSLQ